MRGKRKLKARIRELEIAALDQWSAAHYDHCGLWPHKPGERCTWPPPAGLNPEDERFKTPPPIAAH